MASLARLDRTRSDSSMVDEYSSGSNKTPIGLPGSDSSMVDEYS